MAYIFYDINKYAITHHNEDHASLTGVIYCYYGNELKGYLYFYKDGVSVPKSSKSSTGSLYLRFKENKFRDIVETLRLEKPLYIYFDDDSLRGYLSTFEEPIGEEES